MKNFWGKLLPKLNPDNSKSMDSTPKDPGPPSAADIFRYRYQHGTNLGSIFVLEKWLYQSMFEKGATGSSELAAVQQGLKINGLLPTRQKWEYHWQSALTEADLLWLVETAKCNSIRLPIGHFTLGPQFCIGTAFEGEPAQVYINAWDAVKKLVRDCHTRGIGVLLDFHALPGGANTDAHSGTNSGKADLWTSANYLQLANACVEFIVQEVVNLHMTNVIGIELCNEPSWAASSAVFKWYDEILPMIAAIDPSLPVYIGDCWQLASTMNYALKKNRIENASKRLNPVVVDTHQYYTFGPEDHSQSPQQIIERVNNSLGDVTKNQGSISSNKTALSVYVGEYSCTMDGKTWEKVDCADRPAWTQEFGRAQTARYQQVTSGMAFWTLKMDWMDGGDWGFKKQVNTGALLAPRNFTFSLDEIRSKCQKANKQKVQLREAAVSQHVNYWDKTAPNEKFEHHRFESGWDLGFKDAVDFFSARMNGIIPNTHQEAGGGDRIGALEMWILKRIVESRQLASPFAWQWEHGYRKAVNDFERFVGT